jgi:hypothetical protein
MFLLLARKYEVCVGSTNETKNSKSGSFLLPRAKGKHEKEGMTWEVYRSDSMAHCQELAATTPCLGITADHRKGVSNVHALLARGPMHGGVDSRRHDRFHRSHNKKDRDYYFGLCEF